MSKGFKQNLLVGPQEMIQQGFPTLSRPMRLLFAAFLCEVTGNPVALIQS
jgi:hypothetical protein